MAAHLIAQQGPSKGLTFSLELGDEWVIGSDPAQADFYLEGRGISRKHARVIRTPAGYALTNLSRSHPLHLNGQMISGDPMPLKEGDLIEIGQSVLRFTEEEVLEHSSEYDDMFGDLGENSLPPEPDPIEEAVVEQELKREASEDSAYNTIFEDLSEEKENPFQPLREPPLILKVINGPNAGAEIGLEKGHSYLIGKDPNSCDITFQDLSVSRHHARLTVSSEGICELEDLGSKNGTLVNGVAIADKQIITSKDLIAMGTTLCLILDKEANEETIFAVLPLLQEGSKEEIQEGSFAVEPVSVPVVSSKDWKERKIPVRHLLFAGVGSLLCLFALVSWFSLLRAEKVPSEHQVSSHETLKEAFRRFPGVRYTFNPAGGRLFMVGHVRSGMELQELRYNIAQVDGVYHIEDNIIVDEYVWKMTNDLLSSNLNWRNVNVMSPEPGIFVVQGSVKTVEQGAQLGEYLTLYFPYLDRLQNQVVIEDVLTQQIQSMLQAHGFAMLTVQYTNGELLLGGRYNEDNQREYETLIGELQKLDGIQVVRSFAVPSLASSARIDLTSQYLVTGNAQHDDRGYSVVINGRIYLTGEKLDGMKISAIAMDTIFLERDGVKYKIDYTR